MIQAAREGGSITPSVWAELQPLINSKNLRLKHCVDIETAMWANENTSGMGQWCIKFNDKTDEYADAIWLATGRLVF